MSAEKDGYWLVEQREIHVSTHKVEKSQAKSADEAVRAVLDGKSEIVNTEFSCIHKTSVKPESSIDAVSFYPDEEEKK